MKKSELTIRLLKTQIILDAIETCRKQASKVVMDKSMTLDGKQEILNEILGFMRDLDSRLGDLKTQKGSLSSNKIAAVKTMMLR